MLSNDKKYSILQHKLSEAFLTKMNSVLVSSDELGGEAAKTCSYGVEFHLLDALIGTTEKIVRSKKAHFDILQV